jgi:hypothetical protein
MKLFMKAQWFAATLLMIFAQSLVLQTVLGGEPGEGYRLVGKVRPRHAREIAASNWSVGAETMDRDFTIYKNWKEFLGPLGVKSARIQSGWAKTEKQPGKYDWAWLDEIVNDMVAQGVMPWVCICYGNTIYPDGGGPNLGDGWPRGEEALAAWDRYVAALVKRYRAHVREWEIWNEPGLYKTDDLENARDYADFLIRTAKVVRKQQADAKIVGLSLPALPGIPLPYAETALKEIKDQQEQKLLDEITYHPYSANPDASYPEVEKLRALAEACSPHIRIRQGENGAPSKPDGFGAIARLPWDEYSQAKWALRRLLGDLGRDIPSSYFTICDIVYPEKTNYKGLLAINTDKTVHHTKQAYYAVQHLTSIFDNHVTRIPDFQSRVEYSPEKAEYAIFGYRTDRGAPITALWRSDRPPFDQVASQPVRVVLPGMKFTVPVFVDLVSGEVYEIDKSRFSQKGDVAEFRQLPIADAPVLVAERDAIPLQKESSTGN